MDKYPLPLLKNHRAHQRHHSYAFPPQVPLQEDSKPPILRSQAWTIKSASHYLSKSKQQSSSKMPRFSRYAGDDVVILKEKFEDWNDHFNSLGTKLSL